MELYTYIALLSFFKLLQVYFIFKKYDTIMPKLLKPKLSQQDLKSNIHL